MARGSSHRDEAKEQFWREMISRQPGSGLSIRAYCRRRRVRESAFYFWRGELARRGVSGEPGPAFVPVRLTDDSGPQAAPAVERVVENGRSDTRAGGCIEIMLGSGQCVRIRGVVDRRALADVLWVLVGPSALAATEGQ